MGESGSVHLGLEILIILEDFGAQGLYLALGWLGWMYSDTEYESSIREVTWGGFNGLLKKEK